MLSIEECRALIPDGDKCSDEKIEAIRRDHYEMVELAFDVWLTRRQRPKARDSD